MKKVKKRSGTLELKTIKRQPLLSETVADTLTDYIFENGMRPGDKLPSEMELGKRFGVSRTVIREAVRLLVGKRLIQSQTGTRLVVSTVETEAVGDLLNLVFRGHTYKGESETQQALWSLHEVRSTIEVQIAGFAAERATKNEIEKMRLAARKLEEATNNERRAKADEAFHKAIAGATHNKFFLVILDALVGPLRHLRQATLELKSGAPDAEAAHARILEQISAGNVDGARAAMAIHIAESGQALKIITHQN